MMSYPNVLGLAYSWPRWEPKNLELDSCSWMTEGWIWVLWDVISTKLGSYPWGVDQEYGNQTPGNMRDNKKGASHSWGGGGSQDDVFLGENFWIFQGSERWMLNGYLAWEVWHFLQLNLVHSSTTFDLRKCLTCHLKKRQLNMAQGYISDFEVTKL